MKERDCEPTGVAKPEIGSKSTRLDRSPASSISRRIALHLCASSRWIPVSLLLLLFLFLGVLI